MARRHFDKKGFPKLQEIAKGICDYVEGCHIRDIEPSEQVDGFTVEGAGTSDMMGIFDPRDPYSEYIEVFQYVPTLIKKNPFKITGIYVIGEQANHLPDSYNKSYGTLDLIVMTNVRQITFLGENSLCFEDPLQRKLEGVDSLWINVDKKHYINIVPNSVLAPHYLKIYPTLHKLR